MVGALFIVIVSPSGEEKNCLLRICHFQKASFVFLVYETTVKIVTNVPVSLEEAV